MSAPLARAYANHGRWVADCPRPFCGNAEGLGGWQPWFRCSTCAAEAPVEWPPDPEAITRALAARGAPQFMNWFPDGHPLALLAGCPHGQTVAELHAENTEHAGEIAAWHGFGQIKGGEPLSLGPRR